MSFGTEGKSLKVRLEIVGYKWLYHNFESQWVSRL